MVQMAEYAKIYLVSTVQGCNQEFRPGKQMLPNHVQFWFTAPFVKLCTIILVLADNSFQEAKMQVSYGDKDLSLC